MELTSQIAVWYHPGKPVVPTRWVLIRDPQGEYDPLALLCTTLDYSPLQIVNWFVRRWQITEPVSVRQAAWYVKDRPTFADALSWIRQQLWQASLTFCMSDQDPDS